jgi:hypothetical protein
VSDELTHWHTYAYLYPPQVFTHYAYALESQVAFKDQFYGYGGSLLREVLSQSTTTMTSSDILLCRVVSLQAFLGLPCRIVDC